MLLIVVEYYAQAIVEEIDIDTIVLLEGLLPRYLRIVLGRLVGTLCCGTVFNTE